MIEPAREPSAPRAVDLWTGLRFHLTSWLILGMAAVWLSREILFPGRFALVLLAEFVLLAIVVGLWTPRLGRFWRVTLHSVSLGLLLVVVVELALTRGDSDVVALERYPYPYRTHGVIPNLEADTNRLSLTTNDTGLRHPGPIGPKPEGELRVLVVGGSAVLGVGDQDHETIPAFLEGMLQRQYPSGTLDGTRLVRVINGGQPWYTSTQELVFFVTELALYEPDLVVVLDGYNDAYHTMVWGNRPPSNQVTSEMIASLLNSGQTYRNFTWHDGVRTFLNASNLRRRLRVPTRAVWGQTDRDFPAPDIKSEDPGEGARLSMQHRLVMNWTLWKKLGETLGFRPLFALQPAIYSKAECSLEETEWLEGDRFREHMAEVWRGVETFVQAEATRLDLPLFDADAYVVADDAHAFLDSCHLNGHGNELVARAISERIAEELARWPWSGRWDGIRYEFDEGDPIWRPLNPTVQGNWN